MSETVAIALIVAFSTVTAAVVAPILSGLFQRRVDRNRLEEAMRQQADALRTQAYEHINQAELRIELGEREDKEPDLQELLGHIYAVRALLPSMEGATRGQFRAELTKIRSRAGITEQKEIVGSTFDLLPIGGSVPSLPRTAIFGGDASLGEELTHWMNDLGRFGGLRPRKTHVGEPPRESEEDGPTDG